MTSFIPSKYRSLEAIKKQCNRAYFADLRNLHALVDCREDYLKACWKWLYKEKEPKP